MNLPERLKAVRKRFGYTRRQLATELGWNYATITKYENGEREPGHSYLVEVARKFGVTTDYLLGLEDFPQSEKKAPSREAMQLARAFDTLDEWGRKALQTTLELELQRRGSREPSDVRRSPEGKKAGDARPLAACDYPDGPLELRGSPNLADDAKESDFHG